MHSLLETYLSEVAAHLRGLPVAGRNEELREMRAHLLSAVEAYQELGETEGEAMESTLRQFGPPSEVGSGLVKAWRRGRGSRQGVLLAAGLSVLLMAPYIAGMIFLEPKMEPIRMLWNAVYPYGDALAIVCAGAVTGWASPKRAVVGTALGMIVLLAIGAASCVNRGIPGGFFGLLLGSLWTTKACWPAVLAAWAGSRSRLAWKGRGRLARG